MSWGKIPGYDDVYEVSDKGEIRSVNRQIYQKGKGWRTIKGKRVFDHDNGNGYRYVSLSKNGKKRNFYVHILVAMVFLKDYRKGMTVDHIDFNRANNVSTNLQVITARENALRTWEYGRGNPPAGVRAAQAKLTEKDVIAMRALMNGGASNREVSKIYGIDESTCCHIKHNRTWRHLLKEGEGVKKIRDRRKLSPDNVREIRMKKKAGYKLRDLIAEYNVSKSAIYGVTSGRSWREVK